MIQRSSTPSRSAIGSFVTTLSGTATPSAPIAAPRSTRPFAAVGSAAVAVPSSGNDRLQRLGRARVGARQRDPCEPAEDVAWPELDEALRSALAQREQDLAPAD